MGETRGTGLGPAVAKHILESHGGKIWAEREEGRGAMQQFTRPREDGGGGRSMLRLRAEHTRGIILRNRLFPEHILLAYGEARGVKARRFE